MKTFKPSSYNSESARSAFRKVGVRPARCHTPANPAAKMSSRISGGKALSPSSASGVGPIVRLPSKKANFAGKLASCVESRCARWQHRKEPDQGWANRRISSGGSREKIMWFCPLFEQLPSQSKADVTERIQKIPRNACKRNGSSQSQVKTVLAKADDRTANLVNAAS